jgi:riboflavin kinase
LKYRIVEALKVLALKGAAQGFIPVRTKDLSSWLDISQQSASNRLLELLKLGYIERRWGPRTNQIILTKEGISLLSKEYEELRAIFGDKAKKLEFKGIYEKGIGEGQYYIGQKGYQKQFKQMLGFSPKYGTFNIKLSTQETLKLRRLKGQGGLPIEGFVSNGRTFGAGKCFKAKIDDITCAVMIPNRTHYTDVLEVISEKCLRRTLDLSPGDKVIIQIFL